MSACPCGSGRAPASVRARPGAGSELAVSSSCWGRTQFQAPRRRPPRQPGPASRAPRGSAPGSAAGLRPALPSLQKQERKFAAAPSGGPRGLPRPSPGARPRPGPPAAGRSGPGWTGPGRAAGAGGGLARGCAPGQPSGRRDGSWSRFLWIQALPRPSGAGIWALCPSQARRAAHWGWEGAVWVPLGRPPHSLGPPLPPPRRASPGSARFPGRLPTASWILWGLVCTVAGGGRAD